MRTTVTIDDVLIDSAVEAADPPLRPPWQRQGKYCR